MAIVTENENSFFLTTSATVLQDEKDVASWASPHIVSNPNYKWIVGSYVEANKPNSNNQYWDIGDLRIARPSIHYSPMNLNHNDYQVVGTWVSSELLYPLNDEAQSDLNPYIEVVGPMWKHYFPDAFQEVEKAWKMGELHISMECRGDTVTCVGTDAACGESFPYMGPQSDTYCSHIQERAAYRQIDNPTFLGGALILPPNKPGWKDAVVSGFTNEPEGDQSESIAEQLYRNDPNLTDEQAARIAFSISLAMFER